MKRVILGALSVLLFAMVSLVEARNVKYLLSIDGAMQGANIDGSVRFFFAKQQAPAVAKRLGSASVHEKVSTRPERDEESCRAAFRDAVDALHKRAKRDGADAVVNIVSYFKNETTSSPTGFQCHAGAAACVVEGRDGAISAVTRPFLSSFFSSLRVIS